MHFIMRTGWRCEPQFDEVQFEPAGQQRRKGFQTLSKQTETIAMAVVAQ